MDKLPTWSGPWRRGGRCAVRQYGGPGRWSEWAARGGSEGRQDSGALQQHGEGAGARGAEGDIDRDIRTVTSREAAKPLVRLHHYASHPQTFCCDGRVSPISRARRERGWSGPMAWLAYFTGRRRRDGQKHGIETERAALAGRMQAGMRASIAPRGTRRSAGCSGKEIAPRQALSLVGARAACPVPPRRHHGAFGEVASLPTRFAAAGVAIVHLPGEPLLEFQRYAQRIGRARLWQWLACEISPVPNHEVPAGRL